MERTQLLAAAAIALIATMANAQTTDLFDKLIFSNKNDKLPYRLLKPVNPGAEDKFPLIIFLHGSGERGDDNESQLMHIANLFLDEHRRGKYPCYVLAPQCPKDQVWADYSGKRTSEVSTPSLLVLSLIDKLLEEYRIDKSRIYITGVSMGGFGTWKLLTEKPNLFAAAIPICGGGDPAKVNNIKHIAVWAFHGARDTIVKPENSRRMIAALQTAGGVPGYTEYPDIGHDSWVQAYQEPHLFPWLFRQQITGPKMK